MVRCNESGLTFDITGAVGVRLMEWLGVVNENQRDGKMETTQEKMQRNECEKARRLLPIKSGGISHDVWVVRFIGLPGMQEPIDPVVELANNGDPHYVQVFRNRDELETFVSGLLAVADDAWPKRDA